MIFWDCMNEGFVDENDDSFFVDFTPEYDDVNFVYETQEEFRKWCGDDEYLDQLLKEYKK